MSPLEMVRLLEDQLDKKDVQVMILSRQAAYDVVQFCWAAHWAELLGWDCKTRRRDDETGS